MICPACSSEMNEFEAGGIKVDACTHGCGGIWFDQLELMKFDEVHEAAGEELLNIERHSDLTVDLNQRRNCPRCDNMVLMRHFFSPQHQAAVDECPNCAGFWLDPGELATIRSQYETHEEREKAAEEYFNDLFNEDLAEMSEDSRKQYQWTDNLTHALRFICPSYYMPGKQKWGAF